MMVGGPYGGVGEEKGATDEIQKYCDEVKAELTEKSGIKGSFPMYTALKYRSQVVAGTNYFVKIQVGAEECIHVRLFCPLPCNNDTDRNVFLHGYQVGRNVSDPLDNLDQMKE